MDVNCYIKDDGILPKNVCATCLDKLQVAFELKTKGKESEKYLNEILESATEQETSAPHSHYYESDDHDDLLEPLDISSVSNVRNGVNSGIKEKRKGLKSGEYNCADCGRQFKYVKPYKNHLKLHKNGNIPQIQNTDDDDEDRDSDLLIEDEDVEVNSDVDSDSEFKPPKGERQGNFVCRICKRTFKYQKPFSNHMKTHNLNKRFSKLEQPPYDPVSPYTSPARLESPSARDRDSSPDFTTMVVNSTFLTEKNGESSNKRQRMQTTSFQINAGSTKVSKGRGRPRKKATEPKVKVEQVQENHDEEEAQEEEQSYEEDSILADFSEVDVNSMLKLKPISFLDDSTSISASTTRSRLRSASVEVVQEFDIFGAAVQVDNSPSKTGFGSGKTYECDQKGCTKKFHLKANLKKHQREAHGMK